MDPFDIGAGGTTLTRATQEGVLISNPALLPYGGKFFRWLGLQTTLAPGSDSLKLAKTLSKNPDQIKEVDKALDAAFDHPFHLGISESVSFITSHGGFVAFTSIEPDIRFWKWGDPLEAAGTPSLVVQNELYAGLYASYATKTLWEWLSLGASYKYIQAQETSLRVNLLDKSGITEAQKKLRNVKSTSGMSSGQGLDLSSLFFLQGEHLDFRIATVVENFGGTKFKGEKEDLKQTVNVGTSISLHTGMDALHMSIDYRDALNAYGEEMFKRLYIGTKFLVRTYFGLSAGYYHGAPSYGAEMDLIFLRLKATSYTREYGLRPGVDPRKIYMVSVATGVQF